MHEAANFEHAKFENELINQRLTWFGALQGLLFATLALAWTASTFLVVLISILGISVALSIGIATHRANVRLNQLDPENRSGFGWWLMPGRFVAWPFLVVWLVIFIARIVPVVCRNPR